MDVSAQQQMEILKKIEAHGNFAVEGLSLATVRQWNAYRDVFPPPLLPGDLKDVQRPWAVEALLRFVPPPARLIDFGGARCEVADFLVKLGYDVSVVDPFDGLDGGPKVDDLEAYHQAHPGVRLIRGYFSESMEFPHAEFDAIYSVSVIEHCGRPAQQSIAAGLRRWLAPHGYVVNAIDWNFGPALRNTDLLAHFVRLLGMDADLARIEAAGRADHETYYLSPEAHRVWRDFVRGRTYDEYPYRKAVSLQQVSRKSQLRFTE